MFEFFKNMWARATNALTNLRNAVFGKPYEPKKYSKEFAAALKNPLVKYGEDAYALNSDLDLSKWKVTFIEPAVDQTERRAEIETPRLRFRNVGFGTPEQRKADVEFMANNLYGDPRVTVTYADGKKYTLSEAFWAAINRYKLFEPRMKDGSPFTGFIAELKTTGERVGLLNVGTNGFEMGPTVVEPAAMITSKFHRQGFGTESAVAGILYLSQVKVKGYQTLGKTAFDSMAFTARPNNPIPARLGAEFVKESDKYGAGPENVRNIYNIPAAKMVDIVSNTVERDSVAKKPTISFN